MKTATSEMGTPPEIPADMLAATIEACRKRYHRYPNLLGIGSGLKFKSGKAREGMTCIHFYVSRKLPALPRGIHLPRWVYARTVKGKLDYTRRIPTDVIPIGAARFVQQSGTEILDTGNAGTVTLVFNNRAEPGMPSYLITCAHVVGDFTRSPPIHPVIRYRSGGDLATTVVSTIASQNVVDYDIALARLHKSCTPEEILRIVGTPTTISNFGSASEIKTGLGVACAFPASRLTRAVVASSRTELPITVNGREFLVRNLFFIDRKVMRGDSGGLLYHDGLAVGILVAMSDEGWGLFQPLDEAFGFLQQASKTPLQCF